VYQVKVSQQNGTVIIETDDQDGTTKIVLSPTDAIKLGDSIHAESIVGTNVGRTLANRERLAGQDG